MEKQTDPISWHAELRGVRLWLASASGDDTAVEISRIGMTKDQTQFEVEFYEDNGDQPARRWMRSLSPTKRRALGAAIAHVLAEEGVGVCRTEWGKNLGQSLCEFRLRDEIHSPGRSEKILLRVFFHAYGDKKIVLLHGYDKGEHPSQRYQNEQIDIARRRLKDFLTDRASS